MKDYLVSILMVESDAPFVRVIAAETRDDARAAALASWQVLCINNVAWQPFRTIAQIEVLERPEIGAMEQHWRERSHLFLNPNEPQDPIRYANTLCALCAVSLADHS